MPNQKWTVHLDEGANLLDSIKTPGHKSVLARDAENNLSQATLSPVRYRDDAPKDVALVAIGAAVTLATVGVAYVIRKRRGAKVDDSTETAVEDAESASTEAAESDVARSEIDEHDALIEDTYSVIEDSKATRVTTTPVADPPEEDQDLGSERSRERRRQLRRR